MRAMRIDSPEFKEFLMKWRHAFAQESKRWEGPQAVRALRRQTGYLDFICCKPGERPTPKWMFKGILDEVEDYRTQKKLWQKDFRDTERFLAQIGRRVELRSRATVTVQLKNRLHDLALEIEKCRAGVKSCLGEGTPLGAAWEQLWPHRHRTDTIYRGIDLDHRLQSQCAKMFRIFLRAVSVRTIARLIVLVYWTTDLAVERDNRLWIVSEDRPITVRSVDEKLVRKKFPSETREIPLDEIPWAREAMKRIRQGSR
jgi:hypothetical protein